jgi:hypothetical protein
MSVRGWPGSLTWQNFRLVWSAAAGDTEDAQTEVSIEPSAQVRARQPLFVIHSELGSLATRPATHSWRPCESRSCDPN